MRNDEIQWDRMLKIKTTGWDDTNSDTYRYPYEPTPYGVLERIAQSGYIGKKDTVVDYGTGKGRVCFTLSYQTRCRTIGVEYNPRIYEAALRNKESSVAGRLVEFVNTTAETYELPENVDVCYFFNPFSIEIFKKTFARIVESHDRLPRKLLMIFYWPQDEYASFLMTHDRVQFVDEIDCRDLYDSDNPREKLLIFEVV